MRKRTLLLSIGIAFLFLAGIVLAVIYRYLNSEGFQKKLVIELSKRAKCDVYVERITPTLGFKMRFDSWSPILMAGVDFKEMKLSNADMLPGDFLKAERLRLRYDVLDALFQGRIVLEELKFIRPIIHLDIHGTKFVSQTNRIEAPSSPPRASTPAVKAESSTESDSLALDAPVQTPESQAAARDSERPKLSTAPGRSSIETSSSERRWPSPPAMNLRAFVVEDGTLSIKRENEESLLIEGIQFRSELSADPVAAASGSIHCQSTIVNQRFKLLGPNIKFLWRGDSITIPSWNVQLWNGLISGEFRADQSKPGIPCEMIASISDLNAQDMLKTVGIPGDSFQGKLQAQAKLTGSLQRPKEFSGTGQLRIVEGRVKDFLPLRLVAGYLNRSDLNDIPIQKCEMDFLLEGEKLQIPRGQIFARDFEVAANGWINLESKTEDFNMTLALSDEIARGLPERVLNGLNRRMDGYIELPFRIWGPIDRPQNDLMARFVELKVRALGGAIFDKIFQSVPQR